jgi:phosphatidylglycerol:prolipoprotein diacylglycerol transferase
MTLSAWCYAAGYLTGIIAFAIMAWRRKLLTDGVLMLLGVGLLGGLASANLAQRFAAGSAGKTVLGAVAGGYLCVIVGKKLLGLRRPLGDLFAVGISAGEAVGRFGCFFGGCCYGKACALPWAVHQHDALRHPSQIYLSLANALILIVLLRFERARPPENALFYVQGTLYCASRFLIEFFRDSPSAFLNLSLAQWACIAGVLFFAYRFKRLMTSSGKERSEQGAYPVAEQP